MESCKDCRWWDAYYKEVSRVSCGQCRSDKFRGNVQAVIQSPIKGEWPVDAKYDGFDTGPKFGCVHHEAKVGENDAFLQE